MARQDLIKLLDLTLEFVHFDLSRQHLLLQMCLLALTAGLLKTLYGLSTSAAWAWSRHITI
jgi:hypothetical protein